MTSMQSPIPAERLVPELIKISAGSAGYRDLLSKFGDYLKSYVGIEQVIIKDAVRGSDLASVDELSLNTTKVYIENNLSEYSATELIQYRNMGFRCCAIMPVAKDGRAFATLTLLSTDERGFTKEYADMFTISCALISSEAVAKYEKEKSVNVAKYFDAAFNNSTSQLLIDMGGVIVKANKSALNYFGLSQKDFGSRAIDRIFKLEPDYVSKLNKSIAIETVDIEQGERVFQLHPYRVNENLMHIVISDISAIRDAEAKAGMLGLSIDEAFVQTDKDFRVLWAGGACEMLFGISSDMLTGRKFTDFVSAPAQFGELLSKMQSNSYACQAKLSFGNDTELYAQLKARRGSGGFDFVVSQDFERFTKFSEGIAHDIIELSNDPIIETDESGYILSYNKAADMLFGLGGGFVGAPVSSLCSDDESRSKLTNALGVARNNGYIKDAYINMVELKGNTPIPCVQTTKAMLDRNGRVSSFLIISKELATKRHLQYIEQEFEKSQENLKKVKAESDLKSQFIYNISHDLKTPITNIMGFSKLLLTDGADTLTQEQKDYVKIIYGESDRFLQLVKQILDVAKLQSGIVKLEWQQVNLNEIKDNPSIQALIEACRNKNLEFSWEVDYNVPEITADPNRIIQIFSNLISNAIKFTESGGISVKITRKGGKVNIDISDTGIGISKSDATKIFKKFWQLKPGLIKQEGAGTGLGLSIVKEIAKLHSGNAKVLRSELGKGTTFRVDLPISPNMKKKTAKYNKTE